MKFLTSKYAIPMPHPPQMSNKGNYVVSLSQFVRWLGTVAEEAGVEIYPGFAGAQLLYDVNGAVRGVVTHDAGLDKQLRPKPSFEPGMAFRARVTLLAEGAHGSLTKQASKRFKLREGKEPQTYGIGVKEVWRVDPKNHRPGEVIHTMGYPIDWRSYGGGFIYHMDGGLVSLGLVIGLDYTNPYLSPYKELQVRLSFYFCTPALTSPTEIKTPPLLCLAPRRGRTHRLRWAYAQRRRVPIHSKNRFRRRGVDRVQRRVCKRAQNQGNTHGYEIGHARCRSRI
jgi:hypothetical protein